MDTPSVLPSSPSASEGRIGFLATFTSPAVEGAYRRRHFGDDRWLNCFLVPAAMVRVALFLLADYQHLGVGPAFRSLLVCRLLFLAISAGVLVALRRTATPEAADRLLFGWCFFLGALTVAALAARPAGHTELLLMSFVPVLVAWCVTPLPPWRLAILTLIYSGAALFVCRHTDGATLTTVGLAYVLSNLFGAVTSWRLNHRRREAFLGALREAELRTNLEEAMAEIRTLRGLLCICAWCKRIRDGAKGWEPVETYVQSRTHAAFTHGICPDCQSRVGEITRPCC